MRVTVRELVELFGSCPGGLTVRILGEVSSPAFLFSGPSSDPCLCGFLDRLVRCCFWNLYGVLDIYILEGGDFYGD